MEWRAARREAGCQQSGVAMSEKTWVSSYGDVVVIERSEQVRGAWVA